MSEPEKPKKSPTRAVTIRIPENILTALDNIARRDGRSRSNLAIKFLRDGAKAALKDYKNV